MKRCEWRGKSYSDDRNSCEIDGNPLVAVIALPSSPAEEIPGRGGKPVIRATIVAGIILLIAVLRIGVPDQEKIGYMLFGVAVACGFGVGVVAFLSKRAGGRWSWLKVIFVMVLSYFAFGLLMLALAFGFSVLSSRH